MRAVLRDREGWELLLAMIAVAASVVLAAILLT